MKKYEFDAVIQSHEGMDAAFVEFPYDVEMEFGTKGQVKIKASFDGVEYRGSLARMGYHCHMLGITKKIRSEINKQPGDPVHVILVKDDEERTVQVPEDLQQLLDANEEAKQAFNKLSFTHRKEYVVWITEAKKEETRIKRVTKTVEMLTQGVKHP